MTKVNVATSWYNLCGLCLYPDLEDAFLGLVSRFGWSTPVACYDRAKVIDLLMKDGGSDEQAEEWFSYSTIGTWAGPGTPVFLETLTVEDALAVTDAVPND